ncbi:MAG: AmmeMemoRadiSam system protein B [Proteobacteria bacterium]|nr:AmmeMemoRadiSam system protein B [Pseudomonadota bacterium]
MKPCLWLLGLLAIYLSFPHCCCAWWGDTDDVRGTSARRPEMAGRFYPSDPQRLSAALAAYLEMAVAPSKTPPVALVSPHAGYVYSGQIAADAFNQASPFEYDLVVILGTNHTTAGFHGVSIYPAGGYVTPLGTARIDTPLAEKLMAADEDFTFYPVVHKREHSIEVQVPFAQTLFPGAEILPVVVGAPDPDLCVRFGKALAESIKNRRVLVVASSDLSHYPKYDDAAAVDRKTLSTMLKMDPHRFHFVANRRRDYDVENLSTCACGEAPIMVAMTVARLLGANCGRVVSYANSGDTLIGDQKRVVGYAAVSFSRQSQCGKAFPDDQIPVLSKSEFRLTPDRKAALLSFARRSIRQYLTSETLPLARGFDAVLEQKRGAFVTLKKKGRLRGCIGRMSEDMPLSKTVGYSAVQAAFNDRRFSPLALDELKDVEIKISVLTPQQRVPGVESIQVGRDGVVLEKEGRSAVFLPSVAVEQGWDRDRMLERLCLKARLPGDCWKSEVRLFTFQAQAFGESESIKR